jgi:transcriptional regulator with XRE-family HTH domain
VNDQRVGRIVYALRHRLGWRQEDLAAVAGATQDDVSRIERGRIAAMSIGKLRRVVAALDAELVVTVRWRGGEADRLLDEGHAAIAGWVMALLNGLGWQTHAEVTFALRQERGSIDVLAWHEATRTMLVVEVKTALLSLEEVLRRHDAKQRLAAEIAQARFAGWDSPVAICRLLVLPDRTTTRRHVANHASVLDRAYRLRADEARRWLRAPEGPFSLLLFAPLTRGARGKSSAVSRRRVRRARPSVATRGSDGIHASDA